MSNVDQSATSCGCSLRPVSACVECPWSAMFMRLPPLHVAAPFRMFIVSNAYEATTSCGCSLRPVSATVECP